MFLFKISHTPFQSRSCQNEDTRAAQTLQYHRYNPPTPTCSVDVEGRRVGLGSLPAATTSSSSSSSSSATPPRLPESNPAVKKNPPTWYSCPLAVVMEMTMRVQSSVVGLRLISLYIVGSSPVPGLATHPLQQKTGCRQAHVLHSQITRTT